MVFHLYLVTDAGGSWPLLRDSPLPEVAVPAGTAVVALLGRFERHETASAALALAREAICQRDRRDDGRVDPARLGLEPARQPSPPRARRRRSGRRWIPG